MVKKQIDEYGEGNCCPKCGSSKITKHVQYALQVEEDLNTGKEIVYDFNGERTYNPSNRLLAAKYKRGRSESQCWSYECRKCGWVSGMFTP